MSLVNCYGIYCNAGFVQYRQANNERLQKRYSANGKGGGNGAAGGGAAPGGRQESFGGGADPGPPAGGMGGGGMGGDGGMGGGGYQSYGDPTPASGALGDNMNSNLLGGNPFS